MKGKKILALAVCTAMTATSLTACGGGMKKKNEAKEAKSETVKTSNISSKDYFPLKKPIHVKMVGLREDAFAPMSKMTMFKELEKKTNVKIEWIDWPQSVIQEKRNLMFASGELPDAMYGSWIIGNSDVVKYGNQGFFQPFNEYIDSGIMPNFKRDLDNIPGLKKALSLPNGKIYALPTIDQTSQPLTYDTMVINSEWLKKVGKKMPTTTDELFDVLMAFKKAGDLNGNGKKDEIPMSFCYGNNIKGFHGLYGFTGIPYPEQANLMVIKNDKPQFYPAMKEYKEAMKFFNKLYKNGLIDPEAFTMKPPAYNAKTQANPPIVGFFSIWDSKIINNHIKGNDLSKKGVYQYVKPLKDPKLGVEPKWPLLVHSLNSNLSFLISSKSKYAETLARWVDLQYAPETSIQNMYGAYNKYIKKVGDNKYESMRNSAGKLFTQEVKSKDVPCKYAVGIVLKKDCIWVDRDKGPQCKDAADALYKPYIEMKYCDNSPMLKPEESQKLADIVPDLFAYVDQMAANFITKGNIDGGWNDYIKHLKSLNMDVYVKLMTELNNRAK